MFGLFKSAPRPQEPVRYIGEVEIEKPCEDVYALLDFADPRNAKRALGYDVREIGTGRFQMVMETLPDLTFVFDVREARPARRYEFDCIIEPALPNLVRSNEVYELEPLNEAACRLTLTNTVELRPGLGKREYRHETAMMATSTQSALQKLKLQAEHGAAATKAVENNALI
ncbi:SRPBCC family protein [Altererythrobacter sp. MTPC7]|uniref:SRPBCC family protein n=1 Tax=Altererythrobacter sp. MTPC7 TaxID=3056567 RepID=UPI0036F3154E